MGRAELLPGTLDLLILKAVSLRAEHGYGVLLRIEQITGGALLVEQGALYPALYRLEQQGLLDTEWGTSDNNRKAKFYSLTTAGRKRLKTETERWSVSAGAVNAALQGTGGLRCGGFDPSGAALVRRSDVERQMADELSFHIEARAADLMSRDGLSRDEAIRRARIEFGSIEKYKDEGRASLGLRLIDDLRSDLRFARRALIKNIGFSTAAIAILALGHRRQHRGVQRRRCDVLGTLPVNDPQDLVAFDTLQRRDSMVASYSGNGRPGPGRHQPPHLLLGGDVRTLSRSRDHAVSRLRVRAARLGDRRDRGQRRDGLRAGRERHVLRRAWASQPHWAERSDHPTTGPTLNPRPCCESSLLAASVSRRPRHHRQDDPREPDDLHHRRCHAGNLSWHGSDRDRSI